jgi:arsenate reductase
VAVQKDKGLSREMGTLKASLKKTSAASEGEMGLSCCNPVAFSKINMKRILFLCTGNSCRSQMAEGWANLLLKPNYKAFSAGTKPGTLDPRAVKVMAEAGVDISGHRAKGAGEFKDVAFDLVVTVCDNARETCPVWFGKVEKLHKSFEDPPFLAKEAKSEEEALAHYRRVRDEIKDFVKTLPAIMEGAK